MSQVPMQSSILSSTVHATRGTDNSTLKHRVTSKSWAHFVAGGAGGMAAAVLTSPLDILKTRLQSSFYRSQLNLTHTFPSLNHSRSHSFLRSSLRHAQETFQILNYIRQVEGFRALFRGLGPTLTGFVPASAIKFYTYGNAKRLLSEKFNGGQETAWVHLAAAIVAGIATSTATNPIWVVKTRLQLDRSSAHNVSSRSARRYKNSLDCFIQVLRQEGARGLYRGLTASYLGISESTLQWVLYEQMKMCFARRKERILSTGKTLTAWDEGLDWVGKLGAAGSAKLVAAIVTYPHEVLRTRMRQAPLGNGTQKYTGLIQCFRLVHKEEGLGAMYGGLTPNLLRVVPSAAIMFGVYELLLNML